MSLFRGRLSANNKFDWTNALIDAGLMAVFNFLTTVAGVGIATLFADPLIYLGGAAITAAIGFVATLIMKRGLTPTPYPGPRPPNPPGS